MYLTITKMCQRDEKKYIKCSRRIRTRQIVSLFDRNPTFHNSIILHITHRYHIVNLSDPKPMQYIRHQSLESHIFHTSNHLRRFEIFVGGIAASFAEIINQVSFW